MTLLLVVRHAAHADLGARLTGRADGRPLTPEGERQAEAVAQRLKGEALSEVRTSPRLRARMTAEAIARAGGAALVEDPSLDEIDFGDWTGMAFADLDGRPDWDMWNRARAAARPPNGEAMSEVADRIWAHAAALAARRPGERIALVSHCDVIRALVATCLGLSLDHLLRFEVAPASVSRIAVAPWGMTLLGLNDTGGTS
jgi:probable phosphoglycerate mutase